MLLIGIPETIFLGLPAREDPGHEHAGVPLRVLVEAAVDQREAVAAVASLDPDHEAGHGAASATLHTAGGGAALSAPSNSTPPRHRELLSVTISHTSHCHWRLLAWFHSRQASRIYIISNKILIACSSIILKIKHTFFLPISQISNI